MRESVDLFWFIMSASRVQSRDGVAFSTLDLDGEDHP